MYEVISGACYDMINTFIIAIIICYSKKMNCASMFNISNLFGSKFLSDHVMIYLKR